MIKQFAGASIWSEDINNLLPFYRDVLGLKVSMESPGYALVGQASPDSPAVLLGTHSEVRGRNNDPKRHMVGFASDDLRGDWERLKAAGVEFIEDPTDFEDGMSIATLKDPEGNLVQLFQFQGS
jgi:predicted enzyme related to lactoylglutathione lyase